MNEEQIKGNWKQVKGEVRKKWGMLTDNDLGEIQGRVDILSGKVQARYGKAKAEALKEVNDFIESLKL
jgi:uncharacterized protein YjbJ (UPF0337 family)